MRAKRYSKKNNLNSLIKIFIVSLGCPKNFVDTEVMSGIMLSSGKFTLTFDQNDADIVLINTCSFLRSARDETYETIEDAIEWKRQRPSHRKIVVTGCLIQWDKEQEFLTQFPEVDLWSGVDGVAQIIDSLSLPAGSVTGECGSPTYLYDENSPRLQLTMPHVAYLKVADGCDNRCSYCSIPNIRGGLRSRSLASCVEEAKNLLSNGVKELVLIAQDITAFAHDNDSGENLSKLLLELDNLPGDFWIRLLYTHPAHYTDELIEVIKNSTHIAHYVDVPLQHISDNILLPMGRKVGKAKVLELLEKLRTAMPEIAVRTTFITGFPNETEADYQQLEQIISSYKFDRLGVFAFSPEPHTPALNMSNQIDNSIAEERADKLMALQQEIAFELNQKLVGKTLTVLIDQAEGKHGIGRTYQDAPDIDYCIHVSSEKTLKAGEFYQVKIIEAQEYDLFGQIEQ